MTFAKGIKFFPPPRELAIAREPELPPFRRQFVNAVHAVGRNTKQALLGRAVLVEKETAAARLAICKTCDQFKPSSERCAHPNCACFLRVKTYLKAEKCPERKWGNEDQPTSKPHAYTLTKNVPTLYEPTS